jgi:hypothetical protein
MILPWHSVLSHDSACIFRDESKGVPKAFIAWMNDCHEATHDDIISIDGKCVRDSYNQSYKSDAIHMISAFTAGNEVVL